MVLVLFAPSGTHFMQIFVQFKLEVTIFIFLFHVGVRSISIPYFVGLSLKYFVLIIFVLPHPMTVDNA